MKNILIINAGANLHGSVSWRLSSTMAGNLKDTNYQIRYRDMAVALYFTRGIQGYGERERNEHMDYQSGYLKIIFGIMGFKAGSSLFFTGLAK